MSTLQTVELGVLGPLQVRQDGTPVAIPGAKPRAILTMLGLHDGSVVPADALIKLLWGEDPPRTAAKALQTHISSLRRALGDGLVVTEGAGWRLDGAEVDASRYKSAAKAGRDAAAVGDTSQAVLCLEEALVLWRGVPELPDGQRGLSEKTRWVESHAALVEDRADALLATGRAAEVIGDLEAAVAEAPLRERRWGQLMLALYRAGRQGEALGAYQRVRSLLAEELGVDPGPELRRLETAIVAQDASLDVAVTQHLPSVTRAVTFLLTDIEGSTAAWEADADAMAIALARHDELVDQVVTSRGGRLIKTRGEGDATFSVFDRPSAAAAAAIELQDAITHEPWTSREPIRVRMALHTGEVELRDGDYFGRAVNRVARLRSLAEGGQILCSGATAELVIDTLADDVMLDDLGMRQLKNLTRPEHVFELRLETAAAQPQPQTAEPPMERPSLPAVLVGPGPFVGRGRELERLLSVWQTALAGGVPTVLIAGEPGVGKTRLAGEWSQRAYAQGAVVLYGRCDEDLGAPYQPFAEALRSLVPCMGADRLRGLRGVEALLPLAPGLTDLPPDLVSRAHPDPDTERYALFDAVVALLEIASKSAPVLLILDDLHWAAKPTLLLLRHLLRFGDHARVQIVGTYRSTDLDRSHPLAAMLADLHRDGTANRLSLTGLDEDDVTAYVAEAGYDDEELAHALASVTGGNPFFLIEALRHVDESGGVWDQSTLPQGVREAVSRRLSRLPTETNKALAAAAVVGSRFALELVEQVVGNDLIDAFDEACQAGIVIEEPGGNYRFNHAIVRQSLLAELASVRRMRLHQRIAATLETLPGADDELLAELAHHYFECAWAGNAAKAVFYCRRAADQAMARLAYEGAADLYHQALHALEEIDDELPDRDAQTAELLVARCEALLAAGDVTSAAGAVSQLQQTTVDSARLAAWAACFDGQLSLLIHPERLDEAESALSVAAAKLAQLDDAAGEAKAHTVRAGCLARLGRIADCEIALDDALTAARRAREHRSVNAVLAGAPLAALWGPNPVPRAGGRCLDVVRLLRITTDSPAVEATSTRCQAVLEAFRGRAAAARRMIDSARRTVTELGLRHARLEVEQFAGIVELVVDDPAAAEPYLRKAYNGFRRMGLDADTAETAALLGRTCLALGRDAEADELCAESERLAGHALKASMGWRTLRAHLLARGGDHAAAQRIAEDAVALAERTDALVDHGDACLTLATVLAAAGNTAGARANAEQAVALYERKGAAALAEMARGLLGVQVVPTAAPLPEAPNVQPDNRCAQAIHRLADGLRREAWDEVEQQFAAEISIEGRRKVVGFPRSVMSPSEWVREVRRLHEMGAVRHSNVILAVRGERLALTHSELGTDDESPGAPQVDILRLFGLDEEGRISLHLAFDVDDLDAAIAELDAAHARFEEERPRVPRLENATTRTFERFWSYFAARDWEALAETLAENVSSADHRRVVNAGSQRGREAAIDGLRAAVNIGFTISMLDVVAIRGERLALARVRASGRDPETIQNDALNVVEIDADGRITSVNVFDFEAFETAIAELESRYLAGEATAHSPTWSVIAASYVSLRRRELPATTTDFANIDHRHGAAFAPGDLIEYLRTGWDLDQDVKPYIEAAHRLSDLGAVVTHAAYRTSREGFDAEWREVNLLMVRGDAVSRCELFDQADVDAAIARFDQLCQLVPRLENAASQVGERILAQFAIRDWDAMKETLADNFTNDDRRRVVGAGVRHGRDIEITDARATAEMYPANVTQTVVATRGKNLVLTRLGFSGNGEKSAAFVADVLVVLEIDSDERPVTLVVFDPDDLAAPFADLDSRYLAGEAAPHSQTWSVVAASYAALNRHELPPTTSDCVNIDHRRATAFGPGDVTAYIDTGWDLNQDINIHVEQVHRLSSLGAVVTYSAQETSQEGFNAEWRGIALLTVQGEMVNRCEVFGEADLDSALARFEELQPRTRRLENAASQAAERLRTPFVARDWDGLAEILAEDILTDDRRRLVGTGIRPGRQANVADIRAGADVGAEDITSTVIATRGERISLDLARFSANDQQPAGLNTEFLRVLEVDSDNRMTYCLMFDLDDFEAAIAELDSRYLAGEASTYTHTWSVLQRAFAAFNEHQLPASIPDWVTIDHRRGRAFTSGDLVPYIHATWELAPQARIYVEAVHRLSNLGAVVTQATHGRLPDGFDVEWLEVTLLTVEGDLINRCEIFDEADLDAALARFDELHPQPRRPENAASRADDRFNALFADRRWDEIGALLTDDIQVEDRRRGLRREGNDRAAEIAELRAIADVGITNMTSDVLAIRGKHLALVRTLYAGRDKRPDAFHTELIRIAETDTDERIVAYVAFDLDDFDAAIAELDSRYLAGEASAYAPAWTVVSAAFAALNRHELLPTTPDFVSIDHRRTVAFAPGELIPYVNAGSELNQEITFVEDVHQLNDLGAVVTYASRGTSRDGFDAEWRAITISTVEGDGVNRCELFDDEELPAALAQFEVLCRPARTLENAASQASARYLQRIVAHDWEAAAEVLADDYYTDDRRHIVGGGIYGRDAEIVSAQAQANVGVTHASDTVVAVRGNRLALVRNRYSRRDQGLEAFVVEVLVVVETNAAGRVAAVVAFDLEEIDAAFKELDTRYLACQAGAHADTWSVIAEGYAAMNRHELFPTTRDWVNVDHRRPAIIEEGGLNASLLSLWKLVPDLTFRVQAVHRLSDLGAVCTRVAHGISQDGNDAEWRAVEVITVDGRLIDRCEIFDEADLDAALARFDELHPQTIQPKNAASRVHERFLARFAVRDWPAMAEYLSDASTVEDRRHVVNFGLCKGRDAVVTHLQALETGADVTLSVIATRGERLALTRICSLNRDPQQGEFTVEMLAVAEIDNDERIKAHLLFDPDDVDAASEELNDRYRAGEAAAHAHTWSVIARIYTECNRHQFPAARPDSVFIDHRPLVTIDAVDMAASVRTVLDLTPDISIRVEAVHRLSDLGALVSHALQGTSQEGFVGEWRMIAIFTVDGDLMNRCEIFDETDLDTALARFDELHRQERRPKNAASHVYERFQARFAARDWAAIGEMLVADLHSDDRRPLVGGGARHGRDALIQDLRAVAGVQVTNAASDVIATRGDRLALARARYSRSHDEREAFHVDFLQLIEIDAEARITALVAFDPDDIDAPFAELDARYLAGEAAAETDTWSAIVEAYAAINRGELPSTTTEFEDVDHRRGAAMAPGDMIEFLRSALNQTPDLTIRIAAVHRLGRQSAIITHAANGTSPEGFEAEWREVNLLTTDGEMIKRSEVFEEADLDTALARFDELTRPPSLLENNVAKAWAAVIDAFNRRDMEGLLALGNPNGRFEDRRKGLRDVFEGPGRRKAVQTVFETVPSGWRLEVKPIATRGSRLSLTHGCYRDIEDADRPIVVELLHVTELDGAGLMHAQVNFDPDDMDAAVEELEKRYLAGEAAPYARTWSAIVGVCNSINRGEVPVMSPSLVDIDRRTGVRMAPGDLIDNLRVALDQTVHNALYIVAVHRLTNRGALTTHVAKGTTPEGFDAEWRVTNIITIDGDLVNHVEVFDETDLDAALARFDELDQ